MKRILGRTKKAGDDFRLAPEGRGWAKVGEVPGPFCRRGELREPSPPASPQGLAELGTPRPVSRLTFPQPPCADCPFALSVRHALFIPFHPRGLPAGVVPDQLGVRADGCREQWRCRSRGGTRLERGDPSDLDGRPGGGGEPVFPGGGRSCDGNRHESNRREWCD